MEKNINIKLLSFFALVISIFVMTLGFAAFSSVLTISSSARVTPNSQDFKIFISGSSSDPYEDVISPTVTNGATADNAIVVGNMYTNLKAYFTEPGQSVSFDAYTHNVGKFDAYAKAIYFDNLAGEAVNKKCIAEEGATDALVQAACEGIKIVFVNNTVGVTQYMTVENISENNKLSPGVWISTSIVISYEEGSARADGPFSVNFGNIRFSFSTVN